MSEQVRKELRVRREKLLLELRRLQRQATQMSQLENQIRAIDLILKEYEKENEAGPVGPPSLPDLLAPPRPPVPKRTILSEMIDKSGLIPPLPPISPPFPIPPKRESTTEMVYSILKQAGQPLHADQILSILKTTRLIEIDRATLLSPIYRMAKEQDTFTYLGPATFGLVEWEGGAISRLLRPPRPNLRSEGEDEK